METPRDALAAKHYPKEWAAVANRPGASKKRQQLRQRAEHAEHRVSLQHQGASCASCNGYREAPQGIGFAHQCDADSDFYGSAEAKANGLCHRWKPKQST